MFPDEQSLAKAHLTDSRTAVCETRMSGGVGGRGLATPSYPIPRKRKSYRRIERQAII